MTIATITQLVDDKLRTVALGDLAPAGARDRAIGQALLQYNLDAPQRLSADVTMSGEAFAAPAGWVVDWSQLVAVEHPIGQVPMQTLRAGITMSLSNTQMIVLLYDSLPVTTVRVHFTAPHASDASTVPPQHENALACWAAAELCRQAATKAGFDRDSTIGAANVSAQSQSGELARRAKDWLAQYRTALGLADPEKAGAQPAGTVVAWDGDGHRRGRFSSLGY